MRGANNNPNANKGNYRVRRWALRHEWLGDQLRDGTAHVTLEWQGLVQRAVIHVQLPKLVMLEFKSTKSMPSDFLDHSTPYDMCDGVDWVVYVNGKAVDLPMPDLDTAVSVGILTQDD